MSWLPIQNRVAIQEAAEFLATHDRIELAGKLFEMLEDFKELTTGPARTVYVNGVHVIEGELLRFHVESDRAAQGIPPFLVDLAPWNGNGQCDCEHFRFQFEPGLTSGVIRGAARCKHIVRARSYFCDEIIRRFSKKGMA